MKKKTEVNAKKYIIKILIEKTYFIASIVSKLEQQISRNLVLGLQPAIPKTKKYEILTWNQAE